MTPTDPNVRFDMLMKQSFRDALQREADHRGISAAAMIRLAISEFVQRSETPTKKPKKKGAHARA